MPENTIPDYQSSDQQGTEYTPKASATLIKSDNEERIIAPATEAIDKKYIEGSKSTQSSLEPYQINRPKRIILKATLNE